MKLTAILLLSACLSASAKTGAQGITLSVPADIATTLAAKIERKKGGRDVRHVLRKTIEEPLAEKIVQAPIKKRAFTLKKTKEGTWSVT